MLHSFILRVCGSLSLTWLKTDVADIFLLLSYFYSTFSIQPSYFWDLTYKTCVHGGTMLALEGKLSGRIIISDTVSAKDCALKCQLACCWFCVCVFVCVCVGVSLCYCMSVSTLISTARPLICSFCVQSLVHFLWCTLHGSYCVLIWIAHSNLPLFHYTVTV